MSKYVCGPCGYEYDPEKGDPDNGVAPGTAFEDLPDDWVCPICGVGKDMFEKQDQAPANDFLRKMAIVLIQMFCFIQVRERCNDCNYPAG